MASFMILKSVGLAVAGSYAESKFGPQQKVTPFGGSAFPTFFGLTPLIFSVFSFWVLSHGMVVGKARARCIAGAKQDGEADVDERYAYPNLYAQGTSRHARSFNCVQRSHQHIFESLPQAILTGVVAAVSYPLTAAAASLLYAVGRYYASKGYAEGDGDASQRYKYTLAPYMWYGLMMNLLLGMVSSMNLITGQKLMW